MCFPFIEPPKSSSPVKIALSADRLFSNCEIGGDRSRSERQGNKPHHKADVVNANRFHCIFPSPVRFSYESQIQSPPRGVSLCFSQHSGSVAPNRSAFRNAQRNSFTPGDNSTISDCATGSLIRFRKSWMPMSHNLLGRSVLTCNGRFFVSRSPFAVPVPLAWSDWSVERGLEALSGRSSGVSRSGDRWIKNLGNFFDNRR